MGRRPARFTEARAQPAHPSAALERGVLEGRALEAFVWGLPAVNYDLMLQEMLAKTSGKVNQLIYWGRPLDSKNQTLTPNPDALYFMAFFDTRDGPIVLEVPPGNAQGNSRGPQESRMRCRSAGIGIGVRMPTSAPPVLPRGARPSHEPGAATTMRASCPRISRRSRRRHAKASMRQ